MTWTESTINDLLSNITDICEEVYNDDNGICDSLKKEFIKANRSGIYK